MRRIALGLLIGTAGLQQLSGLPDMGWSWFLFVSSLAGLWLVFYVVRHNAFESLLSPLRRSLLITAVVVLISIGMGFFWSSLAAHWLLAGELSTTLEGQDVMVEGLVASLPETASPQAPLSTSSISSTSDLSRPRISRSHDQQQTRFEFVPERLEWQGEPQPLPGKLLLSWYQNPPPLRVGERWRLQVRLKRPHGFMNPGGFDYEAWLFRQGIRAKGYVREARKSAGQAKSDLVNQRLAAAAGAYPVHQLRQRLRDRLQLALKDHPLRGIVLALAIGDRQQIDSSQWQVLTRTGTNHLVAISGLHVGLVAGFAFFGVRRLWRLSARAVTHWPAAKAGAIAGLLAAIVYALLAGFSVPTQRALVMVAVVMLATLLQRHTRPSSLLALALILVLVMDPMAVLAPGFWLSFGAVGVILYGMSGRLAMRSAWWKWGRVQWLVALGLFPALLLLFQKASLVAPLANLVAVPWVSLVTVPLTLLGALLLGPLHVVGEWLLGLSLWSLEALWWWLEMLSHWRFAQWLQGPPSVWAVVVAVLGVVWLLAPRGVPARWVGAVGLLPLVFLQSASLPLGEAQFTLLDVGQGLAAVVQTRNHLLVFDAGPRFGSGFNTGEAVVAPYLLAQGRGQIHTLVVSHSDNDHMGGVASLLTALPVQRILSSEPQKILEADAQPCAAGQQWQWDGVQFAMLNPVAFVEASNHTENTATQVKPHARHPKRNNRSCVLRVQAGEHSVLLSGDIEEVAEREMLQRLPERVRADVLVVPHHGSKTSSSVAFVEAVSPRIALFPVGYRNRYGFPKAEVVQRYRDRHIQVFDSASHGALEIRLGEVGDLPQVRGYRQTAARYWHDQPRTDSTHQAATVVPRASDRSVTLLQ